MRLSGKKILLGVTGGIAAYKACVLLRELTKAGAEVRVVMTPSATAFVPPLTFSALSGNEVFISALPASPEAGTRSTTWHIDNALWADAMVIAPATVNTIAKIYTGFADNAVTTMVTALRCPLLICPAADMDMYNHAVTRRNLYALEQLGYFVLEADSGMLASGLSGPGRLPEIPKILDALWLCLNRYTKDLAGKKIVVTAGPTYEDVDPVRFLGNRSSGKMGVAIANAASLRGAEVTLIHGPVNVTPHQPVKTIAVRSAAEMFSAVHSEIGAATMLIMAAAVADFTVAAPAGTKLKKEAGVPQLSLVPTIDILASLKGSGKPIIGFALETEEPENSALKKLKAKNLAMVVANRQQQGVTGFEADTNEVVIYHANGEKVPVPLADKFAVANAILNEAARI